jgi:hypothetical protein
MSKFVDDIIKDIKQTPTKWDRYRGDGIRKGFLIISPIGGGPLFSVIQVEFEGVDMPLTYIDRWRLEVAVRKWFKKVDLEHLNL